MATTLSWYLVNYQGIVHVVPRNDVIPHEIAQYCACLPLVEFLEIDDGSYGWLFTHNARDSRK
jgi:hypothetical protein